jgi:hypothetical protein
MTTNDNRMTVFSRTKISLGKDVDIHYYLKMVQDKTVMLFCKMPGRFVWEEWT